MVEKEYIEREAAKEAVVKAVGKGYSPFNAIVMLPAADVRPVVRGRWVDEPIKGVRYHCSVCQGRFDYTWRYCPNCGARMEKS